MVHPHTTSQSKILEFGADFGAQINWQKRPRSGLERWARHERGSFAPFGDTKDIWLRPFVRTARRCRNKLGLDLHHDDDVEVFLQWCPGLIRTHRLQKPGDVRLPLEQGACKALKIGTNVLAIHCRQETGGQYIDAGLVAIPATKPLVELVRRDGPTVWGTEKTQSYLDLHRKLQNLRKQKITEPGIEIMCVEERGQSPTYVAIRARAAPQGDRVTSGFPEVLVASNAVVPPALTRKETTTALRIG